jgi:ferredoxin
VAERSPRASRSHGGGAGIEVSIDHGMCSGTRNCERGYPEVFSVHDGKSWLRDDVDWSEVDGGRLQEAEEACPWTAIETSQNEGAS